MWCCQWESIMMHQGPIHWHTMIGGLPKHFQAKIYIMSCPSWQWHRAGSCWSPVRTLQVAPLWCDLGFVPNSRGNKAAANLRPNEFCTLLAERFVFAGTWRQVAACLYGGTFSTVYLCYLVFNSSKAKICTVVPHDTWTWKFQTKFIIIAG